jgi:uncharacterized membrane protein YbhN (UPF0104 family)
VGQPRIVALVARHKRVAAAFVLLAIAGIIIPQAAEFGQSLQILSRASWPFVLAAIFLTVVNYLLLAEIYHLLVKQPVSLRALQLVQMATGLVSRLAPIGVGTVALTILFLRRRQHSLPQAVAVVTAAGTVLFTAHFAVLAVVGLLAPLPDHLRPAISRQAVLYGLAAAGLILIGTPPPGAPLCYRGFDTYRGSAGQLPWPAA